MKEEEYITQRLDKQIIWYSNKSSFNKKLHLWSKALIIIFAALIPFAAGFISSEKPWLNFSIALLGVLTAILTGLSSLLKFQENWKEYRTTSETLKHEKYLFITKSFPYNSSENVFNTFVNRVEHLISKENTIWNQNNENKM